MIVVDHHLNPWQTLEIDSRHICVKETKCEFCDPFSDFMFCGISDPRNLSLLQITANLGFVRRAFFWKSENEMSKLVLENSGVNRNFL